MGRVKYGLKRMQKRKSWRKFRKDKRNEGMIRKACFTILILELAFFIRESKIPFIYIEREEEHHMVRETVMEEAGGGETIEIFGLRIRLKEGVIEFYRKEEVKSIH